MRENCKSGLRRGGEGKAPPRHPYPRARPTRSLRYARQMAVGLLLLIEQAEGQVHLDARCGMHVVRDLLQRRDTVSIDDRTQLLHVDPLAITPVPQVVSH